jgi:RNA polymerase sigma-70 factor, ECF subfamily
MRKEVAEAIALLREGDPAATEKALGLLQSTVFSFSMRVCGQREDAEDTMQEVLLKSLRYLSRFENPRALGVWLYKVAKNRCLMTRRRSKFAPKQDLSLEELMPDGQELAVLATSGRVNPESMAIRGEQARRLREIVQRLPPQYRIVLVLRDMEGLTDDEVAEITGIKPGNVRVRLHRARLFVRKELSRSAKRVPVAGDSKPAVQVRPRRCRDLFAELSNYLDDQLDDSLCEELEKHMSGCGPCQAFLDTLEATIRRIRETPGVAPNPHRATRLRRDLMDQLQETLAAAKK